MLLKCCTQYASKFGKLSSGHRTGKDQFSFQSQRKAMPKNDPGHPGALLGMARVAHFESSPEAASRVQKSLEVNPRYVPALVFAAQLDLEREAYPAAEERITKALAVNPSSLEALSLLAATRWLQGDSAGFREAKI